MPQKLDNVKMMENQKYSNIIFRSKKMGKRKNTEEATKYLKKFLEDEGVKVDFEKCLNDKAIEDLC